MLTMMDPMEALTYGTIRIECSLRNGAVSCGTGFFFNLIQVSEQQTFPVIVTNKHVVEGAVTGRLHFNMATPEGRHATGRHHGVELHGFDEMWIPHPDPQVDLAIFPVGALLNEIERATGQKVLFTSLPPDLIASPDERFDLTAMEEVVMVGYPNGIWDDVHNMPIIRRGVTATHVKNRWRGRDEFLTDMATFPGSSGSPVLLANAGSFATKMGIVMGTRFKLLGVLHSVFQHTASGEIVMTPAPTTTRPISVTNVPNNLGVVVNALRIMDFVPIVQSM